MGGSGSRRPPAPDDDKIDVICLAKILARMNVVDRREAERPPSDDKTDIPCLAKRLARINAADRRAEAKRRARRSRRRIWSPLRWIPLWLRL